MRSSADFMASLSPRSCCMAAARSCVAKLGRQPLFGWISCFSPSSCADNYPLKQISLGCCMS